MNSSVVESLNSLARPTKVPVLPIPTLTVDKPIKLEFIFATNSFVPSTKGLVGVAYVTPAVIIPTVDIPIPSSPSKRGSTFGEYVTSSPVFKSWSGRYIPLAAICTIDIPAPGFVKWETCTNPGVKPYPTCSVGSK